MSHENTDNSEEDDVVGYHIFKAYDKGNFTSDSNYEYGFDTFEEAMERAEELKGYCLSNGQPMQHLAIFQNGEAGSEWAWSKEDSKDPLYSGIPLYFEDDEDDDEDDDSDVEDAHVVVLDGSHLWNNAQVIL